nr:hypothetical protein [Tanacetum cinerariifolium]
MSTPKFAEKHNLIAFLEKPIERDGFEQIVDFLNSNPINPSRWEEGYCYEASIRRDLILDDAEGTACLPTAAIFEELARIGVLSLEQIKTNQAVEIEKLKKRVKKLEGKKKKKRTHGLKRLYKVGLSARSISSYEEGLGDQEDASKQGRIAEIDAGEDLSLINETAQDQERMSEEDLFEVHDLDGDEVIVDITGGENVEQDATVAEKEDDVTLAQTLIEIKAAKPRAIGVIVQEPKPEKPLKKKDQITIDEEIARKLEARMKAEMEKEERIAREKVEANIAVVEQWEIVEERLKKTQVEVTEGSSKRAGDEIEQESAKRQMLEKEDDYVELKRCLEIVYEDDDDTMFEHHVKDSIWKYQQGAVKVYDWKLLDSYGVYCVTTRNMVYYLLVEKMYPLTNNIQHQMWKDVRLQVDYEVEMAYDLLRLIRRQINEGYIPA